MSPRVLQLPTSQALLPVTGFPSGPLKPCLCRSATPARRGRSGSGALAAGALHPGKRECLQRPAASVSRETRPVHEDPVHEDPFTKTRSPGPVHKDPVHEDNVSSPPQRRQRTSRPNPAHGKPPSTRRRALPRKKRRTSRLEHGSGSPQDAGAGRRFAGKARRRVDACIGEEKQRRMRAFGQARACAEPGSRSRGAPADRLSSS